MRLSDKVAIVTGAGGGMGRETALKFAAEGARIVAADLRKEAAEETVKLIRAAGGEGLAVQCDVSQPEAHQRTVAEALNAYGKLNILYNNAAIVDRSPGGDVGLEQISIETWNRIIGVNLTGVFLGCKYAIPEIVRSGGGSVVNVASVGALTAQKAKNHAYVTSKTALVGLTRNLAYEYATKNVRVNCLCPGQIRTEMMADYFNDPVMKQRFVDGTPMGRFGEPQEIANVALFLASDESSFMTGSVVVADGGWTVV